MNPERFWEAEVRETLTSIVRIVETFMVKRDDEGRIIEECLWERHLAPVTLP